MMQGIVPFNLIVWIQSSIMSICCVIEHDTLSALLQSTLLNCEYKMKFLCERFKAMSCLEKVTCSVNTFLLLIVIMLVR